MGSVIGLGLAIGLIVIGLIGMLVAGVKSVMKGKQDLKKILAFVVPFVVFGIALLISGDVAVAGMATMLFMIGIMALLIVLTGFRSTLNI